MEESYRVYRAVIAGGLQAMRPRLQMETTGLEEFQERRENFDPQVVICGGASLRA